MAPTSRVMAAVNSEAPNQLKFDSANASRTTAPTVPALPTPSSTPPTPNAFVSDTLDPTTEALLVVFKTRLRKLKPPTSRDNLFPFVYGVREVIESAVSTKWLLHPLGESTAPNAVLFSMICATYIQELVPAHCFLSKSRPSTTYELLEELKKSVPSPFFRKPRQLKVMPLRNRTETICDYIDRFDQWTALYSPDADQCPYVVQLYAKFMWASHARMYDLPYLEPIFIEKLQSFNVMADVYSWFMEQYVLEYPPPVLVSV